MTVALGLALAALGTVLLGVLALPHPPDLFYLPVAAVARRGRSVPAMLTAFAAGLAEDALATPGRLWGLHSFTKVLVAYLLAAIGARALVEKPVLLGLLVWGAVVVDGLVATLLLWILRGEPLQPVLSSLAFRAAGTGLLAAVLQAIFRHPWKERRAARRRRRLA
ncbi:MAG TPA: hypothetical protein P5164_06950 [Thermoanaerobaculia bacterium]|nr:hypothetical protein [Thermoanaerobaculia bacterium]